MWPELETFWWRPHSVNNNKTFPLTFAGKTCKVVKIIDFWQLGQFPALWPVLHLMLPWGILTLGSCLATGSHLRNTGRLYTKMIGGIALPSASSSLWENKQVFVWGASDCISSCSLDWTAEVIAAHACFPQASSNTFTFPYRSDS